MEPLFNIQLEGVDSLRITIQHKTEGIREGLERGVKRATIGLESFYKTDVLNGQIVKSHSHNLARSTHHDYPDRFTGVVSWGAEAPYAVMVDGGTRAHIIEARNAQALTFTPNAGAIRASAFARSAGIRKTLQANMVFARSVHHPGTAPTHFAE